jgi:acyl-CoA reductase-like NAD-dependent aldehyde dehydrogenase
MPRVMSDVVFRCVRVLYQSRRSSSLVDTLQVVETATAVTSTLMGDKLEVSNDMDTYSRRLPLGVCAAITPFNFPAM